jgi:hypothetical protein
MPWYSIAKVMLFSKVRSLMVALLGCIFLAVQKEIRVCKASVEVEVGALSRKMVCTIMGKWVTIVLRLYLSKAPEIELYLYYKRRRESVPSYPGIATGDTYLVAKLIKSRNHGKIEKSRGFRLATGHRHR